MRNLLYHCDALVLASRSEVQPLVLLEAMSTGIPVISTECVPQNLRIESGCTIVPIDDVEALSVAMGNMINYNKFDGVTISNSVNSLSSLRVISQQLSVLFNDVLSSAKQRPDA